MVAARGAVASYSTGEPSRRYVPDADDGEWGRREERSSGGRGGGRYGGREGGRGGSGRSDYGGAGRGGRGGGYSASGGGRQSFGGRSSSFQVCPLPFRRHCYRGAHTRVWVESVLQLSPASLSLTRHRLCTGRAPSIRRPSRRPWRGQPAPVLRRPTPIRRARSAVSIRPWRAGAREGCEYPCPAQPHAAVTDTAPRVSCTGRAPSIVPSPRPWRGQPTRIIRRPQLFLPGSHRAFRRPSHRGGWCESVIPQPRTERATGVVHAGGAPSIRRP
jgi:hypothetical protein